MYPIASECRRRAVTTAAVMSAVALCVAVGCGARPVAWWDVVRGTASAIDADVVWHIRAPRAALGYLAGATLAVGGLALQAVFRNPLATPYTLGISAGASVGAALYMKSGASLDVFGIPGLTLAAWTSALVATGLVLALARAGRGLSTSTLLLTGVALGFFFSSVVLFTQYVGDVVTSFRVGRWLMGGLEVVGFASVWHLVPFAAVGLATVFAMRGDLDLMAIGDAAAASRGMSVVRAKLTVLVAVSTMVAAVVALCGPIGFVGLIVPHVGRLLIGPRHDRLVPLTFFSGGAFLVVCDLAARSVAAPVEIPVGIVTALLGGPFFLVLLLRERAAAERARGVA